MLKLFDLEHEFFRPKGVRLAVTAIIALWAIFEFVTGAAFWGVLFGALALWCGWSFFGPDAYHERQGVTKESPDQNSQG